MSHHDPQTTIEDDAAIARLLAQDMSIESQHDHHHDDYAAATTEPSSSTFESDTALAQRMSMEQQQAQATFESDAELARRLAAGEEATSSDANTNGYGGGGSGGGVFGGIIPPAPGHRRANPPTRPTSNNNSSTRGSTLTCPGNHSLDVFEVSPAQRVRCNVCGRSLRAGRRLHSCIECDYDVCGECYDRGGPPPQSSTSSSPSPFSAPRSSSFSQPLPNPPPQSSVPDNHMCVVPCIIGDGACVEMMVDTGAQSSVISYSLARELKLDNRLDRRCRGVAAGVGRAAILGRIRHVICTMGNVEFDMDFMVLDVPDKMLLLGLDLMRKFKCIVDLERQRLVFGGMDGVDVPFLPPEEQHIPAAMMNGNNCPMM